MSAVGFAYCFNTLYLKHKHALIINHEISHSPKNLIVMKKSLIGVGVLLMLILVAFGVQTMMEGRAKGPALLFLPCCVVTCINLYFSLNKTIIEHAARVWKLKKESLEFQCARFKFFRNNRVQPQSSGVEMQENTA